MNERAFGPYPGLAIVGGGGLSGLYSTAGAPPGGWGTGLQHLFYQDARQDLVHTATSLLRLPDGRVEWGNRTYDFRRHPERLRPVRLFNRDGYRYGGSFRCRGAQVERTETLHAAADGVLRFDLCLVNHGTEALALEVYALVIFQGDLGGGASVAYPTLAHWRGIDPRKHLAVHVPWASQGGVTIDSPSGFLYRTLQALHPTGRTELVQSVTATQPIGLLLGGVANIEPGGRWESSWWLSAGDSPNEAASRAVAGHEGTAYWESWYARGTDLPLRDPAWSHWYRANLAAIRAAVMPSGFVPADMTGQYFAGGRPSYYARDALMTARGLLLAGHESEAGAILRYLAARPTKENGEFYQRYDAAGEPAEGQNNGVPHQLDSQGYFSHLVYLWWRRTGEWLVDLDRLAASLDLLAGCIGPQGMAGPEGGVNEGVFGPAYITSTNLCLYGGLQGGIELARHAGDTARVRAWESLQRRLAEGIEAAWLADLQRYAYGFTTYAPEPVRRYDTPQYFGPLYGYPIDARFRRNDRTLRRDARFLGAGVGYSEQEYHHGPWTFNTAACAEVQALVGNWREYERIVRWLTGHANQFGQMPESFSADHPDQCQVNPLVWGCAEAVAALAILATQDGHVTGRLDGADRFLENSGGR